MGTHEQRAQTANSACFSLNFRISVLQTRCSFTCSGSQKEQVDMDGELEIEMFGGSQTSTRPVTRKEEIIVSGLGHTEQKKLQGCRVKRAGMMSEPCESHARIIS